MNTPATARSRPIALLFGLLTLGLYLATLTQVHTFDALSYVTSVERKPWTEVFHPHHLAYGPLGVLALHVGQILGYTGGAALPMQVVNALAGALGVALFYDLVVRLTARIDTALVVSILLAGSYAYWYYAVEIEVYTVAALFLVLCLRLLARTQPPTTMQMALLGLAQAGAILFHQTNVLLCFPILVWYLADWQAAETLRQRPAVRITGLLIYACVLGLVVTLPYLWVGFGVSGFGSFDAFMAWMTEYARTGWWGGPLNNAKWAGLAKGLAETIAAGIGGWLGIGLALVGITAGVRGWGGRATEGRTSTALFSALLVWLVVYAGFFFWWEPDNIEFWIASLPPVLLLLALGLRQARPWGILSWLAFGLALATAGVNLGAIRLRGDARTDLQRAVAQALAEQSTPSDLLVIPDGLQELYLPYYQQRENFISLNQAIFDADGNWDQACATIQSRIEIARHAGATAIIAEAALHPEELLLTRHRVTQAQVDACFLPFRTELQPLQLASGVPGYDRLPRAHELADGVGWIFAATRLGWVAAHTSVDRVAAGWQLLPGSDPNLLSPLLQLDTSRYRGVVIRLANRTQARDAQIFLIGPDGRADEAHALRWQLRPGSEMQTYELDLRSTPGWSGTLARLRIDPIGVGDGNMLVIESIQLLR